MHVAGMLVFCGFLSYSTFWKRKGEREKGWKKEGGIKSQKIFWIGKTFFADLELRSFLPFSIFFTKEQKIKWGRNRARNRKRKKEIERKKRKKEGEKSRNNNHDMEWFIHFLPLSQSSFSLFQWTFSLSSCTFSLLLSSLTSECPFYFSLVILMMVLVYPISWIQIFFSLSPSHSLLILKKIFPQSSQSLVSKLSNSFPFGKSNSKNNKKGTETRDQTWTVLKVVSPSFFLSSLSLPLSLSSLSLSFVSLSSIFFVLPSPLLWWSKKSEFLTKSLQREREWEEKERKKKRENGRKKKESMNKSGRISSFFDFSRIGIVNNE